MKLFTTKCHERATLWKLWRQAGNRSLLPVKCWPRLHVIRACSWWWPMLLLESRRIFQNLLLFCSRFEILEKQSSLFPSEPVSPMFIRLFTRQMKIPSYTTVRSPWTNWLLAGLCKRLSTLCRFNKLTSIFYTSVLFYVITQVILAFWLVLVYDVL